MINVIIVNKQSRELQQKAFPETDEGNKQAEQYFLDLCSTHFSNWNEYTQKDIDAILDVGYEESNCNKIVICHGS